MSKCTVTNPVTQVFPTNFRNTHLKYEGKILTGSERQGETGLERDFFLFPCVWRERHHHGPWADGATTSIGFAGLASGPLGSASPCKLKYLTLVCDRKIEALITWRTATCQMEESVHNRPALSGSRATEGLAEDSRQ